MCTEANTGKLIKPLGLIDVVVRYREQQAVLSPHVVDGSGPYLLGRDWLHIIRLDRVDIYSVHATFPSPYSRLEGILEKHQVLFEPGLMRLFCARGQLHLKEGVSPQFILPQTVQYALHDRVKVELDRLENVGLIEPVVHSEWAMPVVKVLKQNGGIHLCCYFKVIVNPNLCMEQCPLSSIDEICSKLAGSRNFTKLDLHDADFHLEITPKDRHLLTVNTCQGMYQYTHLCFSDASALAMWQKAMDHLCDDLPFMVDKPVFM